jgi:hypothetical protein
MIAGDKLHAAVLGPSFLGLSFRCRCVWAGDGVTPYRASGLARRMAAQQDAGQRRREEGIWCRKW